MKNDEPASPLGFLASILLRWHSELFTGIYICPWFFRNKDMKWT